MWLAYVLLCRDIELACDEKVVAPMEKDARRAYSTALLNCSVRRRSIAVCPLAFGEVGVKDRVKNVMNYKKPAFWIVIVALLACVAAAVCFLTVPRSAGDPRVLAEDGSGMPAPPGGTDPYADLEPARRAAAFLQNADMMSYELSPIPMYGTYIVPAMEYAPYNPAAASGLDYTLDHTDLILGYLHDFDLSALEPLELSDIEAFEAQVSVSGLIHVGDARCRVAVWYDQKPVEGQEFHSALVFTFSDGTMCGFDGGVSGENCSDIYTAIGMAGSRRTYALFDTDGPMTVTQLSTGESRTSSMYAAALVGCVFDNTVLLAPPAKEKNGSFDWQVSFADGPTYLFDYDNLLIQTEDGQVFPLGGFDESKDGVSYTDAICAFVLNGFDVPHPPLLGS